ncbi:MAG: DUF362 domain-containing protein [Candidatus Eisenbacteria bacterium]|jgi:hypothetical protein|nr:DUF362 domain-containing protein [Candidatus Eisenbacteria bacterium]
MFRISRRRFIGAAAAAVGVGLVGARNAVRAGPSWRGGGLYPGKGVTVWHPGATTGRTVNVEAVQQMMDRGLEALSGEGNPVSALERLLPGLNAQSKVAVKINLIAGTTHCWTRWEVVQALVNRLTETLGGSFSPANIAIFDQHDLPSHGYTADRFPGVVLSSDNDCNSGVMIPTPGQQSELSRFIAEADFLINCPVVKNHGSNEFTLGMKNHYGSVAPSSWCGNYDGLLAINAAHGIREKTALVLLDGLFGTYVSGLDGGPDNWTLFPGGTPRRLFFGTDPCVIEHLGQQIINEQRQGLGLSPLTDYYLHRASDPPYELGVNDPAVMDLSFVDASVVPVSEPPRPSQAELRPAAPNPFATSTAWTIRLRAARHVRAAVYDITGREIAMVNQGHMNEGAHVLRWDGHGADGRRQPPGIYLLVITGDGPTLTSPVSLIR